MVRPIKTLVLFHTLEIIICADFTFEYEPRTAEVLLAVAKAKHGDVWIKL